MLRLRNLFAATKIILNMKRNKCISCLFIMLFFAYFDKKNEICSHARLLFDYYGSYGWFWYGIFFWKLFIYALWFAIKIKISSHFQPEIFNIFRPSFLWCKFFCFKIWSIVSVAVHFDQWNMLQWYEQQNMTLVCQC